MSINERAAYIKGLAEGLGIDDTTKEGKIITALVELCGDMADKIGALEDECAELREYVEELDEDLGAVEEDFYTDDGEEEEDGEDDEMGDYFEIECPACGEKVCFDESLDADELFCPNCGKKIELDICDGECDGCDDTECEVRGQIED